MRRSSEFGEARQRSGWQRVAAVIAGLSLTAAACSRGDEKPVALLEGSRHPETQQFGAPTFIYNRETRRFTGNGPLMPIGTKVIVDCLVKLDPPMPSARSGFYHVESPAPFTNTVVAANTFENGSTEGPLSQQPAVDPAVPTCPE